MLEHACFVWLVFSPLIISRALACFPLFFGVDVVFMLLFLKCCVLLNCCLSVYCVLQQIDHHVFFCLGIGWQCNMCQYC